MGLTAEKILAGAHLVHRLDSFPIFCGYMLMILLAGQWKRFTKPLSLRPILVAYNFTASVISLYTLYGFGYGLYHAESTFDGRPSELLVPVYKLYWFMKIFELLDTVFMVLRHKQRQISFLHIYHHGSMLILGDIAFHFYPYTAFATYLGLNSAVHVLLYFYYGLSALYPDNPPQWKKFLTQFQIIQFFIDLIHATIGYLYHNYCIYGILYGLTMVTLFSNFYYKAYVKKRAPVSKPETNGEPVTNDINNGEIRNGVTKGDIIRNGVTNGDVRNGVAYSDIRKRH
ncbi:elongation of very long chain fatty acids protein 5-like [Mercenaria mercenaria]|uniref:elongation of very long chain fatty acids protein 5-like n=1 Tax=Mercenaria mercenaria TaxID=6596 RepID=UPI00234ED702|nr:elongation of very long chain fatty acids protein 5-like [Mercenaria mercenaria]XP_045214689.2 elongation of very long chain fatty acids protein 5-like [Mercenaria mercenaria]XP_045214691.2 elongation of very long chain fatty acids protein 5-like [Mercenaria mercenaria]XP_045214692.2 elongation of very long chain fatty acids protein 5-like [Mercenaria mercenaria]XP_045214693.2 elongation of very long chain fatty acids protein 5-like [Mercenaria mercenaria]